MKRLILFLFIAPACWGQYAVYTTGSGATVIVPPVPDGFPVATGDSRTVTEPSLTALTICSQVHATKYIVSTNTIDRDPFKTGCGSLSGTFGTIGCTGSSSFEPSNTSASFNSDETLDTAIQTAINACPAGQAVELIPSTDVPPKMGFVVGLLSLKNAGGSGVKLLGDMGIHVWASRNPATYGGTCGQIPGSCGNHWITAANTSGAGIYGYFVLDGRGWDRYTSSSSQSFYINRLQSYCNNRGKASHGSPACTPAADVGFSYGPTVLNLINADDFTLYKTTLKDAGGFNLNWKLSDGGTFWDYKILSPHEVSNTDGTDTVDSTNATFAYGFISNGDNHCAFKADGSGPTNANISFLHNQTRAGIGCVLGSATESESNILVDHLVQDGNLYNDQSEGIGIGSSTKNGGSVDTITFQNVCMMNESKAIRIYSNYGGQTGSHTPIYTNVLLRNITVLPSTAPYITGKSGTFTFQGLSGFPAGIQLDNIDIQGTNEGIETQGAATNDRYASVLLGPGQVDSSLAGTSGQLLVPPATAVTLSGTAGTSTSYPCSTSMVQFLVGELNLKTSVRNNNQSYSGTAPYTLQAMVEPTTSISTKESAQPTGSVQFKDGATVIATVALGGDGTFAQYTVPTAGSGTHTYTAHYVGDSNYSAFDFGSVTVTVP
jgi:polygalacturonase